jgi:hypothetical protein
MTVVPAADQGRLIPALVVRATAGKADQAPRE